VSGNRRQMIFGFIEKIYYPSYNRMDGLTLGVGIAAIFSFRPKTKDYLAKHGNIVLLVGIGLFIFAYNISMNFISYKTAIYGFPLFSIAYGAIVIAAISPTSVLYKLRSKTSFIIATLSYAVYLTHKQLFYLTKIGIEKLGLGDIGIWTFWICVGVAFIGSFILHLIVEKPFLALRKRILNRIRKNNEPTGIMILNYIKNKVNNKARP
jgi:peptidoglycan/LPS O-acetylase OafA/YrhL